MQSNIFDVIVLIPPNKVKKFIYLCDSRFHIEEIEDLFEKSNTQYGLVCIEGEDCKFYSFNDIGNFELLYKFHSDLPNKHRRGGQSSVRFSRLRDENIHRYTNFILEQILKLYTHSGLFIIKKLILYGPTGKKEIVKNKLEEHKVSTVLITGQDMSDITIKNIIDSQLCLTNSENDSKYEKEIEENIRINIDRIIFGKEIIDAYKENRIDILWISDSFELQFTDNKTQITKINSNILKKYGNAVGLLFQ